MKHIDLFSGIGGFALAVDRTWYDKKTEHTFVENDPFCQAILKKHWPQAEVHGDIREFIADTNRNRKRGGGYRTVQKKDGKIPERYNDAKLSDTTTHILTGGFPCQPFSHAGRRKGTADDRYLWPAMFDTVTLFKPRWVIAENVAGLASWNEGLVLETVCSDLEGEGYEVQTFVIPAAAVGAPHRRDRVWIVAHSTDSDDRGDTGEFPQKDEQQTKKRQERRPSEPSGADCNDAPHPNSEGHKRRDKTIRAEETERRGDIRFNWSAAWQTVADYTCKELVLREEKAVESDDEEKSVSKIIGRVSASACHDGVDDGLSYRMDGTTISAAKHRRERLKACGNAIVPQVAEEIMKAIRQVDAG